MLRYDLEQALINNELQIENIEKAWNDLFYKYFGIEVKNVRDGVLQDVHWSGGSFGYFPTYALGSAYAAQFYHYINKDIDIEQAMKSGTTKQINEWLKDKIHKYGASLYPKEIIKLATGEDFNPEYYVNYLINKYSKIYGIK
jgi:carboxypeptidase Taq